MTPGTHRTPAAAWPADEVPDNCPVLVGIGLVSQHEDDVARAAEPVELMVRAVRAAGEDSGDVDNLRHAEQIGIPQGRWSYGDPARMIGRAIGADSARTLMAKVGVLQQTLIGKACRSIADGERNAVLVVGGEAGYRLLRARKTGVPAPETPDDGAPDEMLLPQHPLRAPAEIAAGLVMPVGLYALVDSALRAARRETLQDRRNHINAMYARFSEIAAGNPHAWSRRPMTPDEIGAPGPHNSLQASPYLRHHCSNWSVDQASALLFLSAGMARRLRVPAEKWVFALASSESNHMETVSSRPILHRSPGARVAGEALLRSSGIPVDEIDLLDLYSCFPVAPDIVANELGIAGDRPLTITGGMAFAGGPYNNYVLHATGQMGLHLRQRHGSTGLVGCISGVITKQAFGLWSTTPPRDGFRFIDVTEAVAAAATPLAVHERYSGPARIAAWTILNSSEGIPHLVVIADTPDGGRCVARTSDAALIRDLETREVADRPIDVLDGVLSLAPPLAPH